MFEINVNHVILFNIELNFLFFLAFLDHVYPLTNPLYVINFSKKTTLGPLGKYVFYTLR
jgi:hypothetical protein